jgi:GNAT superfamily N-acetyltransferase
MSPVRVLKVSDIPQAMLLKDAEGWNQTEQDWRRLLELAPDGCFGIEHKGKLVATTTAISYGLTLAWIGMVITAPEFRGRGLASRLMETALAYLDARQMQCVKLDATSMGSGLYRRFGFEDERPVERWLRAAAPASAPNIAGKAGDWDAQLDRLVFGIDRSALLAMLARVESMSIPGGYALGRPGSHAAYFGPCIATDPRVAKSLLDWFVSRHANEAIYWDLLPENADAVNLARGLQFARSRQLVRMARRLPEADFLPTRSDQIYAIAGLELG